MQHDQQTLDPAHDFGGQGPLLHLAHANGFPPAAYQPLAEELTAHYHVVGLPARPLWPGSCPASAPTWHPLAGDLIAWLDRLGIQGIVGVGHSLGGVLTLLAAVGRPDLFSSVVLIDPVVLPPGRLRALCLLRLLRLERRLPLVRAAVRRRRIWPSREACLAHLARKPFFAGWPEASLQAYVKAGFRDREEGQVELVYPPDWEAQIFASTPTDIWRYVPKLSVPSLWMRGERSSTFSAECTVRVARLLPHATTLTLPNAGHMVPFEQPAETARHIRAFLENQSLPGQGSDSAAPTER